MIAGCLRPLRLSGPTGVWAAVGGPAVAGNGVVVGVIDTGIWPESASFAGTPLADAADPNDPTKAYRQGRQTVQLKASGETFTGTCQTGQQFTADLCNTKLISARYFGDSFLRSVPAEALPPAPASRSSRPATTTRPPSPTEISSTAPSSTVGSPR